MIKELKDINTLLNYLGEKPSLILTEDVSLLSSYISFFEGFFLSLKLSKDIDLERDISSWYQKKVEFKAPNMNWFAQFKLINNDSLEEDKIKMFLSNIKEFYNDMLIRGSGR